jgi:predicted ribosome quality control (RQC) complex YloA/Tae2 family protein
MSTSPSSIVKEPPVSYQEVQDREEAKRILVYDFLGYSVFVGCNAKANERLVADHKLNHPKCLWMHVVGRKGPHVILCVGNVPVGNIDMIVLRYAASRSLKFSGLKFGKVTYAPLEDVYKPEKSQEGIYRTWRTNTIEL